MPSPSREDLFRMLDLEPTKEEDVDLGIKDAKEKVDEDEGCVDGSNYCFVLDDWDIAHGHDLYKNRPDTARHVSEDAFADFHAMCFLPYPTLEKRANDHSRRRFIDRLLESPDFAVLKTSTEMDLLATEAAAINIAKEYAKLMEYLPGKNEEQRDRAYILAVNGIVEASEDEIEELFSCQNAIGLGQGANSNPLEIAKIKETFNRVKRSQMLKRICELAGRYRLMAQAKQRQKATHGLDDVVGVTVSGDISKLVPVELAMLADADFEDDAIRRLIDNQSLSREYRGVQSVGKGPIVVCVDESGSMSGERIENAKAFALSMAWVARHQNRWCCLIGYSGGTYGTKVVLKPNKWDEVALLDWLTHFYGGGTTMDVPLQELPTTYWKEIQPPKGKTDIICITDGQVSVSDSMIRSFNAFKEREKVKMISIIIQGYPGDLKKVSDETFTVNGIGTNEDAVQRCLSL